MQQSYKVYQAHKVFKAQSLYELYNFINLINSYGKRSFILRCIRIQDGFTIFNLRQSHFKQGTAV